MSDDEYMCPFCVTPWKCNGPHITEDELPQFNAAIEEAYQRGRKDLADTLRSLHEFEPHPYGDCCYECGGEWPCSTIKVLDGEQA